MAVVATEIIVGNIIIAKTIITANKLCPLGKLNVFLIQGTIIASPKTPYNTEGIPANNSTAGTIIFATFLGAISEIKIDVNKPIGTPISKAPMVPNIVAIIIGSMPNLLELGYQSVPIIKSINEYPSAKYKSHD